MNTKTSKILLKLLVSSCAMFTLACGMEEQGQLFISDSKDTPQSRPQLSADQKEEPTSSDPYADYEYDPDYWEDDDGLLRFVGATAIEQPMINQCLSSWPDHPFEGDVFNYKRILASVNVMSAGNAVRDTVATPEPHFTLVTAAVNVMGMTRYKLMNPNGYYCIEVNVNVGAMVTIDLHCDAHIGTSLVNVNVQGSSGGDGASVEVNVGGKVTIRRVDEYGNRCY